MSGKSLDLLHAGVLPEDYLVERVAMRAHDLVGRLREHQVAHLRACVYGVKRLQCVGVPESDVSVGCATTCCQEPVLVRGPTDCFDSGGVFVELDDRLV